MATLNLKGRIINEMVKGLAEHKRYIVNKGDIHRFEQISNTFEFIFEVFVSFFEKINVFNYFTQDYL